MQSEPQSRIPTQNDILFEISNFSNSQLEQNSLNSTQTNTAVSISEIKKIQNLVINTNLTPEAVQILSSIDFADFRKSPFNHQFDLLFNDVQFFKNAATQGILIDTNLRFLSWMISLNCLPFDKNEWLNSINKNRQIYDDIKFKLTIDPRKSENFPADHPLSSENTSDWNSYFVNNDLKLIIEQDVSRINRHNEFLNHDSTQDLLIELLFLFVKHTNYEYRQGMHEILACVLYVVHEEYSNLLKREDLNGILTPIVDLKYLEHDSFTIFSAIMETVYEWFNAKPNTIKTKRTSSWLQESPKLFVADVEDIDNPIVNKINNITFNLLRNNDSELYFYFVKNDISLAPFGIRWLRLLFLRELQFPTCLILWDAIFATDKLSFGLVDYIFLSLLMSLRLDILKSDHSNCMRLLMQQHAHLNPLEVLKRALYLKYPDTFSNPEVLDEDSYEYVTKHLIQHYQNEHSDMKYKQQKIHVSQSASDFQYQQQRQYTDPNKSAKPNHPSNYDYFDRLNTNTTYQSRLLYEEMKLFRVEHMDYNKDLVMNLYINEITNLQKENQMLITKLQELQELCFLCSTKLNANICLLQDEIVKSSEKNNDIVIAVAGLKQIRDQLTIQSDHESTNVNSSANSDDSKLIEKNKHESMESYTEVDFDESVVNITKSECVDN